MNKLKIKRYTHKFKDNKINNLEKITIFSIPKPFKGKMAIIQENAIKSWLKLEAEIILFGDEEGISDISKRYNIKQIKNIKKSKYGTPYVDDVFKKINIIAKNNILCFVNTDILLFKDFINKIRIINFNNYLICGARWDMEISKPINFNNNWEKRLKDNVYHFGKMHSKGGLDYFVFKKNSENTKLPSLLVGRAGWDNYFIAKTSKLNIPIIDATESILVVHQNHDYSHIKIRTGKKWEGPETKYNLINVGSMKNIGDLSYSNFILDEKGEIKKRKVSIKKNLKIIVGKLDEILGGYLLFAYYNYKRLIRLIK